MHTVEDKYWELIAREFAGETSPEEKRLLEDWKKEDPKNEEIFRLSENDWNLAGDELFASARTAEAWKAQKDRIFPANDLISTKTVLLRSHPFLRVAAFILLFLSVGTTLYFLNRKENQGMYPTKDIADLNVQILPDGSRVSLNQGARIKFSRDFENERLVSLEGEAFFDVASDSARPFIVETGDARIRVLGTSFNVLSSFKSEDVEVLVESGKVQLMLREDEQQALTLEPGNIGTLHNRQLTKTINTNKNYLAWKTKELYFENTPMSEVVNVLEKVYHIDVVVSDTRLAGCRLNSTFSNQQLDFVLDVICSTFNLQRKDETNQIILIGGGC